MDKVSMKISSDVWNIREDKKKKKAASQWEAALKDLFDFCLVCLFSEGDENSL